MDAAGEGGLKWPNIRKEYVVDGDQFGITAQNKKSRGMYADPCPRLALHGQMHVIFQNKT